MTGAIYRPVPPPRPLSWYVRARAWVRGAWAAVRCAVRVHASYGTYECYLGSFYYTCGRCGRTWRSDT